MLTAPLDKLSDNTQAQDIAASRGPTDVWRDCYRVKAYNKWEDVPPYTHPAQWEFPQPFQVASERTGRPWVETNRTFLGQLADYNLACDFCYRGQTGATVDVTPAAYAEAFKAYNEAFPDEQAGVMRISGGEPMLYEEWVVELVEETEESFGCGPYRWLDTNLTIQPTEDLVDLLSANRDSLGVCGCFKPGAWDLSYQIAIARRLVRGGADCYFYWPCSDDLSCFDFDGFLADLDAAIPFAPLRLTVLNIKYNYAAVKEKNPEDWQEKHERAQANLGPRRQQWAEWCANNYPVWMCNTPSQQVKIG